jgi:uncharacterized membrane protein required for colicin V production
LNAWDVLFALGLLAAAWLGSKIKSLRLLGITFVITVTPWLSKSLSPALGHWLISSAHGAGLRPHQNLVAWWLIALSTTALLLFIFNGFSRMAKALYLEFFDRGLGSLVTGLIFFFLLSLNIERLARMQNTLRESWTYQKLKVTERPEWIAEAGDKIQEVKKKIKAY